MSRSKNDTIILNRVLVPREFAVRHVSTWTEGPSLIFVLDGRDQRKPLREIFGINWEDIDVRMRDIDACVRDGVEVDSRIRHAQNVKVVHDLKVVDEGILIRLTVRSMFDDRGAPFHRAPDLDGGGNLQWDAKGDLQRQDAPAKLTFERLFPTDSVRELFSTANAFAKGMDCIKLLYKANVVENFDVVAALEADLTRGWDTLNGASRGPLTVPLKDEVERKQGERKGGRNGKKGGGKDEKAAAPHTGTATDSAEQTTDKLVQALGLDPDVPLEGDVDSDETSFGDLVTPVPVASASPTPAPAASKPTKQDDKKRDKRTAPVKLTLKDIESLKVPVADGSNDQK